MVFGRRSSVGGASSSASFSSKERDRLQRRFARFASLSEPKDRLSIEDIDGVAELGTNPLLPLIFSLYDEDNQRALTYDQFTNAISALKSTSDDSARRKLAFRVYDRDKDGKISMSDLASVLRIVAGGDLDDGNIEKIVKVIMANHDHDKDGVLSEKEFQVLLSDADIEARFTVSA